MESEGRKAGVNQHVTRVITATTVVEVMCDRCRFMDEEEVVVPVVVAAEVGSRFVGRWCVKK